MSIHASTEEKPDASTTDADSDEEPDLDAPVFGVDQRGCLHRFDAATGDVVVTRDGDLERVERDVSRDGVDHWISYVGSERGWIDVWWNAQGVDTVARLAAALETADELDAAADQEGDA